MHTPKRTRRLPHETTRGSRRGGEKKGEIFFFFFLQCVCASLITNLSRDTDRARIRRLLCDSRKKADGQNRRERGVDTRKRTRSSHELFKTRTRPVRLLFVQIEVQSPKERDASTLTSSVLLLAFLAFYTFYFHQNYLSK